MQHHITSYACVPLVWDDVARQWLVDPTEMHRGQLEGPEPPDHARNDDCQCGDPDECEEVARRAIDGAFPTVGDLSPMLAHGLALAGYALNSPRLRRTR